MLCQVQRKESKDSVCKFCGVVGYVKTTPYVSKARKSRYRVASEKILRMTTFLMILAASISYVFWFSGKRSPSLADESPKELVNLVGYAMAGIFLLGCLGVLVSLRMLSHAEKRDQEKETQMPGRKFRCKKCKSMWAESTEGVMLWHRPRAAK
jgi:hypothetical protein